MCAAISTARGARRDAPRPDEMLFVIAMTTVRGRTRVGGLGRRDCEFDGQR
jgi:hypothetical protein